MTRATKIQRGGKALAEAIDTSQKASEKNLVALFDDVVEKFPDNDALFSLYQPDHLGLGDSINGADKAPVRWTYSQLQKGSIRLAAHLSSKGIVQGGRAVAVLNNEIEWALLFWATARLGCQFVPLDPRILDQKEDSLHVMKKVSPSAVFVSSETMAERVDGIVDDMDTRPVFKCVVNVAGSMESLSLSGWATLLNAVTDVPDGVSPVADISPEDTVLILFTSGTTSRPKGCPHTAVTIGSPSIMLVNQWGLDPSHSVCQHLPTFHIFNIVLNLAFWLAGATVILPGPSFDSENCFSAIKTSPKVHVPCVPSLVQALTTYAAAAPADRKLESPYSIIIGGAPITPDILQLAQTLGPKQIVAGWGTTEAVGTAMNVMEASKLDVVNDEVCLGPPRAGSWLRFCAPGSRAPIRRGEIGELHHGGLPVFAGYLDGTEEEMASCYQADGVNWSATGDQGFMDEDGRIYLLGRYKDLIIRGGENISPTKIENCLGKMPGVHAAYVVGVPDAVAGEVPIAVMTKEANIQVKPAELQAAVLAELGRAFSPTMILDLHEDLEKEKYPTTTSGKIQKPALREWVKEYMSRRSDANCEASSNDILGELKACWSEVTGLKQEEIDIDASINTFADSTMVIQFFHIASKRLARLTNADLVISDTVRKQSEMLQQKKQDSELSERSDSPGDEADIYSDPIISLPQAEQAVSPKLTSMGFKWEDVEEVIPATDYLKHCARNQIRPFDWNHRMTWKVKTPITAPEMQDALYHWLERHPMLRTTLASYSEDVELYTVMRPSPEWMKLQVVRGDAVDDMETVANVDPEDPKNEWIDGQGPLFRATIFTSRKNPSHVAGICLHAHHVTFDAHSMRRWIQDLKDVLRRMPTESSLPFHPYREFALDYHRYRSSKSAQKALDFHVQRLKGASSHPGAMWPPPRTTKSRDGKAFRRQNILSRCVHLPRVQRMRSLLGVSAVRIAKGACALINVRHTGEEEAMFASMDSGRSWPSAGDNPRPNAGHPLEIDGPTITWTLDRIKVPFTETARQFLVRVAREQDEMLSYTHVPLDMLGKALLEQPTGAADVAFITEIILQQQFNWAMNQYHEQESDPISLVDRLVHDHLGLVWFPSLRPGDVMHLVAARDDLQFGAEEVRGFMDEYLSAMAWLSDPENLDKPLSQCNFRYGEPYDLLGEGEGEGEGGREQWKIL